MAISKKQIAQQNAWDKENCIRFNLKLNKNTDADIIEKLKNVESKQGYIKQLIRDDIAKKW